MKARREEGRRTGRGTESMVPACRLMKVACPMHHAKPDAECALLAGSRQTRQGLLACRLSGGCGRDNALDTGYECAPDGAALPTGSVHRTAAEAAAKPTARELRARSDKFVVRGGLALLAAFTLTAFLGPGSHASTSTRAVTRTTHPPHRPYAGPEPAPAAHRPLEPLLWEPVHVLMRLRQFRNLRKRLGAAPQAHARAQQGRDEAATRRWPVAAPSTRPGYSSGTRTRYWGIGRNGYVRPGRPLNAYGRTGATTEAPLPVRSDVPPGRTLPAHCAAHYLLPEPLASPFLGIPPWRLLGIRRRGTVRTEPCA